MGSVYRRKSDGLWVAAISTGPRGNRTVTTRYRKTKREAEEALAELRSLTRPPSGSRTTVSQYLRSWLEVAGRRSLKASTWRTYDVALRLHIDPSIGHIALARLSAEDVDLMLATSTLDPKGQRNVLGFLGRVLDVAQARGHVLRNAARLVEPPRVVRQEREPLHEAEARRVIAAVRGDRLEALWVLAIASGLRQAELLGLRWQDVNLDARAIRVVYSLARVDGRYVLDEPKTRKSRRPLAIPDVAVDALREHRARQLAERMGAGVPTEDGLVFLSPEGRPLNGGWVSHRWRALSRAIGVNVTFHDLRHTNATILRDHGVSREVRQDRLGWVAESGMDTRYAHATEGPDRAAADEMQQALVG